MGWPLRELRNTDLDFVRLLERYEGRLVSVVTGDSMRLLGTLASVNSDAVRLVHVQITDQLESGGWMDQMLLGSPDDRTGPQWPEVLVSIHMLRTVCCLDDGILDVPLEDDFPKLAPPAPPTPIEIELPDYDPIRMELGLRLVPLADATQGGRLLERVRHCRELISRETGWSPPKVRVQDATHLSPFTYRIVVQDVAVFEGELQIGQSLAVASLTVTEPLPGLQTVEPVYGLPAWWIEAGDRETAEAQGYTVIEPVNVLATALTETLRRYAGDLLSFNAVEGMLSHLEDSHLATVRNLYPSVVSLPLLHEILRELLTDGVSLRSLPRIVESLGRLILNGVPREALYAQLRTELGRQICEPFLSAERQLDTMTFNAPLVATLRSMAGEKSDVTARAWWNRLVALLKQQLDQTPTSSKRVLMVEPELRIPVRNALRKLLPRLAVLTLAEVPFDVRFGPTSQVTEAALEDAGESERLSTEMGDEPNVALPQHPR